jgi:hypothetical protein
LVGWLVCLIDIDGVDSLRDVGWERGGLRVSGRVGRSRRVSGMDVLLTWYAFQRGGARDGLVDMVGEISARLCVLYVWSWVFGFCCVGGVMSGVVWCGVDCGVGYGGCCWSGLATFVLFRTQDTQLTTPTPRNHTIGKKERSSVAALKSVVVVSDRNWLLKA